MKIKTFESYLGKINVPKQKLVLDWIRAAEIIKERKATNVSAGLKDEPISHDVIYRLTPVFRDESMAFVESSYDVPVIIIGDEMLECYKLVSVDAESEFWPVEAQAIVNQIYSNV